MIRLLYRFRWFRRLRGGKWTRWYIDFPVVGEFWFPESEGIDENHRPGLGRGTPTIEDWRTTVWIVGKRSGTGDDDAAVWEFEGVFTKEQRAVEACQDADWFVAPARLDEQLPEAVVPWRGLYFPLGEVRS